MFDKFFKILIIVLISVLVGIIIGIITTKNIKYHGPNAIKFCDRIYYSKNDDKYFKFKIQPLVCSNNDLFYRIFI